MATTTLTFGPGYKNSANNIWSIRRQVLTIKPNTDTSSIFTSPNRPISSLTSITLPFRSGEYIPASKIYDNIKVIIFKGFNDSYIDTETSNANWFVFTGDHNGLAKESSSNITGAGFIYNNINTLATTPLAYFSGNVTVTSSAQDLTATFSNPTFTDAGKSLANWYVSTSDDDYAKNRLYVGVYHDSTTNWTDASGNEATLNWTYPTSDTGSILTLGYSAGAIVKYYNGSSWQDCEVCYYNGSSWQPCEIQYYDGSAWQIIGG